MKTVGGHNPTPLSSLPVGARFRVLRLSKKAVFKKIADRESTGPHGRYKFEDTELVALVDPQTQTEEEEEN